MSGLLAAVRKADSLARSQSSDKGRARPRPQAGVVGGPELVSYKTSQTGSRLVPHVLRLQRLRRRVRWAASSFVAEHQSGHRPNPWMVTLTYREIDDWRPDHISTFTDRVRKYLKRKFQAKMRYVWVAELQKRGAVHYHFLVWMPPGASFPMPDKQGWWPHGSTWRARAKRPVGYVTKYVSKCADFGHEMPKALRLYGIGGMNASDLRWFRYLRLPEWLRQSTAPGHQCTPMQGGGWVSRRTGEMFFSPFVVESIEFVPGLGRVVNITRRNPLEPTK